MEILSDILNIILPHIVDAQGYVPLSGTSEELGITPNAGANLSEFLTKMFAVLISITGVLGVLMLVIGGIQYMTTDAVFGKSLGKSRITSATGGLILALSSWIILNTINPDLLSNKLDLSDIEAEIRQDIGTLGLVGLQIGAKVPEHLVDEAYSQLPPAQVAAILGNREAFDDLPLSTQIRLLEQAGLTNVENRSALYEYLNKPESAMASNILLAAQAAANSRLQTCGVPGTNSGRLACAYTVNHIVEAATGRAISEGAQGLSTIYMASALRNDSRFRQVNGNLSVAEPGDIVISPTVRGRTGHVGIVEEYGASSIISNSSSNAEVQRNFTAESWTRRYVDQQDLEVLIFRPN